MSIQPATASDVSAISDFLQSVELPVEDLTPDHLTHFRVLRDGEGAVCGTVGLEVFGAVALLRSLAVHPEVRGQGFGQSLVLEIEALARSEAVRALYLLTETAEAFFNRLGYSAIERDSVPPDVAATAEFDRLCGSDATCMWKQLGTLGYT
jgi:amino-acid N-acetyltransferase